MCFVILGRVLIVALVELFMELLLGCLDFLINILDDLVHVLSLAHLTEDVSLEFQHRFLDNTVVEIDHVGRDLSAELRILVHNWLQVLFTKSVSIDMVQRFVEELRLVAEEVFVTANNGLLAKLDVEVALLLIAEADAVLA